MYFTKILQRIFLEAKQSEASLSYFPFWTPIQFYSQTLGCEFTYYALWSHNAPLFWNSHGPWLPLTLTWEETMTTSKRGSSKMSKSKGKAAWNSSTKAKLYYGNNTLSYCNRNESIYSLKKKEADKTSSVMKDLLSSRYLNWSLPLHHCYWGPRWNRSIIKLPSNLQQNVESRIRNSMLAI